METISVILVGLPALAAALLFSPLMISALLTGSRRATAIATGAGMAGFALNTAVPVLLHWTGTPITRSSLGGTHLAISCALAGCCAARRVSFKGIRFDGWQIPTAAAILAFLFVPWTYLAGIDTYKWQCLASNVRLAQCIPWLIHPLSLLGFTPRAYPAAQPLFLATTQILAPVGVDWGFYLVSLFTSVTGLCAAYELGLQRFGAPRTALWLAVLYVSSPVFIRYTHWATGRGVFMAVLPMVLLHAGSLPRPRAVAGLAVSACLLALSHKTGLVTLAVLAAGAAAAPMFCGPVFRPALWLMGIVAAIAAPVIAPPGFFPGPFGHLVGAARTAITRFGILLPFIPAFAMAAPARPVLSTRALLLPGFLFFLLSFDSDMYAALPATLLAALATTALVSRLDGHKFAGKVRTLVVASLAIGALAIVGNRNLAATPRYVHRAALVIETLDPEGPMLVEAPGMARRQLHAYVSGCPRFEVHPSSSEIIFAPFPSIRGAPSAVLRSWIAWGRDAVAIDDVVTDWYGNPHAIYHVRIRGEGTIPAGSEIVYSDADVVIGRQLLSAAR